MKESRQEFGGPVRGFAGIEQPAGWLVRLEIVGSRRRRRPTARIDRKDSPVFGSSREREPRTLTVRDVSPPPAVADDGRTTMTDTLASPAVLTAAPQPWSAPFCRRVVNCCSAVTTRTSTAHGWSSSQQCYTTPATRADPGGVAVSPPANGGDRAGEPVSLSSAGPNADPLAPCTEPSPRTKLTEYPDHRARESPSTQITAPTAMPTRPGRSVTTGRPARFRTLSELDGAGHRRCAMMPGGRSARCNRGR